MLTLINIIVLLFASCWLWRSNREIIFWSALIAKLVAGISVGLIYQYYYSTGDTWNFFHDAERIVNAMKTNPSVALDILWSNDLSSIPEMANNEHYRAIYFAKWVAFFNMLDGGNYWVTSLWFSFISFLGSWVLFEQIKSVFPTVKLEAAVAIFFVPSIIFWGSGVIKESLSIACLFSISALFLSFYIERKISLIKLLIALILFWILWRLKYYWAIVWFITTGPIVFVTLISKYYQLSKNQLRLIALVLLLSMAFISSFLRADFHIDKLLAAIVVNHDAYVSISHQEGLIHFNELQPTVTSFLINSPWAVFSAFFRPSIIESHSLLQWFAAIENIVLLILVAMSIVNVVKMKWSLTLFDWSVILYIVLLAVFLALSTPNLGSLSRFRIGFTPYLWFLSLIGSGLMEQFYFKRPS